jgi:hypothetical protein
MSIQMSSNLKNFCTRLVQNAGSRLCFTAVIAVDAVLTPEILKNLLSQSCSFTHCPRRHAFL